jgi:hypothetical protein
VQDREAKWLIQAQKGDPQAFTHIVEEYQRPVYNLCHRMLGNAQDAEDAAQESFLKAYKAMNRYDPNRSFSSWLRKNGFALECSWMCWIPRIERLWCCITGTTTRTRKSARLYRCPSAQ